MTYTTEQLVALDSSELLALLRELEEKASLVGCSWAEANKAYRDIQLMLPSVLAQLICEYIEEGHTPTVAKQYALSSEVYIEQVQLSIDRERDAELLKVEFRSLSESMKCLSAIAYVRNQELKSLGNYGK